MALVLGPIARSTTPEVLRVVRMHPAKSASAYSVRVSAEAGSPDQDTRRRVKVELMWATSL
eukprot:8280763-Prorocentrum_lima.AAC.1